METTQETTQNPFRSSRAPTNARGEAERLFHSPSPRTQAPPPTKAPEVTGARKPRILPALTPQEWQERQASISEEPPKAPAVEKQTPNREKISGKQFAQIVSLLKTGMNVPEVAKVYGLSKTDIYQELYARRIRLHALRGRSGLFNAAGRAEVSPRCNTG